MSATHWSLSIAYWLHMLATVTWIGGLAALAWLILPAARQSLTPVNYAQFLDNLQKRFDPLAWFSLAILIGTGMLQMGASPNYEGFFTIDNLWAGAIFIKHIIFIAMVCVSAYLTWVLLPRIRRLALLRVREQAKLPGADPLRAVGAHPNSQEHSGIFPEIELCILRQEENLMRLNLILGVVILGLTAIARAV
ncbi:MAG TPA: hypothetical protein VLM80_04415 [Anaerolineales bacterium]|nr:hypothetical protein [Anaerolineales bacterium]